MSVAANIRKHRQRRGFTQERLAALVGKNRVTITKYELGQIDIPLSVLQQIAKGLKVPLRTLLASDPETVAAGQ